MSGYMTLRKNNAFLLIEVLITVAIVSGSIVFINHAFTSSLRAAALSSDYASAVFLLEDESFEIELGSKEAAEGVSSGESQFMGTKFLWAQQIMPLEDEDLGGEYEDEYEDGELGLKRLNLSVTWKKQNRERSVEILTYVQSEEPEE